MEVDKDLVMVGVVVRFVSVDVDRRSIRDVVLSIEVVCVMYMFRWQVIWLLYGVSFNTASHIASARVRDGGLDSMVCMTSL